MSTKMAKSDIETGGGGGNELYPGMKESSELRWAFIRKVYSILSLQMLLTVGVSAVVYFVRPIPEFITETHRGVAVFFVVLILPFLLLWPLLAFEKKHPINCIVLSIFTLSISFAVGICCSLSKGRIVLEAAILTSVMVFGLTIYTFWAVKRGHDFSFLGPFLFGALLIILAFSLLQIFHPLGKLSSMIFSGIASIVFCGYIIFDTNQLIKKLNYDEYIPAAIRLYLDVMNLFLNLLGIMSNAQ
ncbi:Bax inhibitor 1-related [Arabidopsis suecica]|uniref:Bax inhibitor 1-related n=1 Tax=Arabidopsis suecica TaxID=45249 RepID=A0A8T1YNH7_ARASU|nr:Bax inhibitor 1-related [Arabidopsis suecica]